MNATRRTAGIVVVLGLAIGGCGSGGDLPSRPIETLMYVTGASGTSFEFADTADVADCKSNGTGIQSPNASHQFPGRTFIPPHLFVMENLFQPMRAVIRNTSTVPLPIQVNIFLGTVQRTQDTIEPGECRTIVTDEPPPPFPTPKPRGAQVQLEVCSPINPDTGDPQIGLDCIGSTADRHISYFATVGDVANSSITNCVLTPLLPACQTPSTFFLEQPKDEVDAVMSVNSGQNPGGLPTAEVHLQLYVNGLNVSNNGGTNPVVKDTL